MPDKNGEVWAGVLHGRQMLRFNPKTGHWAAYQMPEPYAYDRRTYIDASTHPVTVWYVDYNGYLWSAFSRSTRCCRRKGCNSS